MSKSLQRYGVVYGPGVPPFAEFTSKDDAEQYAQWRSEDEEYPFKVVEL